MWNINWQNKDSNRQIGKWSRKTDWIYVVRIGVLQKNWFLNGLVDYILIIFFIVDGSNIVLKVFISGYNYC